MIRVGIVGFGNLGKCVLERVQKEPQMQAVCVFTRRPQQVVCNVPVYDLCEASKFAKDLDVLALCLGSRVDLPRYAPKLAQTFCTVDAFDVHAEMSSYRKSLEEENLKHQTCSIIGVGWDPGLLSVLRTYAVALNGQAIVQTLWGKGVSQGHSNMLRQIDGVTDAVQFTVPKRGVRRRIRKGEIIGETEAHRRVCYVSTTATAGRGRIVKEIRSIPHYFQGYDVRVHFCSQRKVQRYRAALPHEGFVGIVDSANECKAGFSLKLHSNPLFTAAVTVVYLRAAVRLKELGHYGCFDVTEIPVSWLTDRKDMI